MTEKQHKILMKAFSNDVYSSEKLELRSLVIKDIKNKSGIEVNRPPYNDVITINGVEIECYRLADEYDKTLFYFQIIYSDPNTPVDIFYKIRINRYPYKDFYTYTTIEQRQQKLNKILQRNE